MVPKRELNSGYKLQLLTNLNSSPQCQQSMFPDNKIMPFFHFNMSVLILCLESACILKTQTCNAANTFNSIPMSVREFSLASEKIERYVKQHN